jgi:heme/copper-type cytochrome/quinol oxidase subunit 2
MEAKMISQVIRKMLIRSACLCLALPSVVQVHTIEILADKDSRYKIAGQPTPLVVLKAGEKVVLRFTAVRAKTWNRDGSIHGFALLRASDRSKVAGWNLLLRPGTQEFTLTAPTEPGQYEALCTIICSDDHEGMHMRVVVTD